jgi:phage/plasmid-associated DNA primase
MDTREVSNTHVLKSLTVGEPVTSRLSYGRDKEWTSFVKICFLMNEFPRVNGSDADARRFILIRFDKQTEDGKTDLERRKAIECEAAGIYNLLEAQFPELLKLTELPHGLSKEYEQQFYDSINVIDILSESKLT